MAVPSILCRPGTCAGTQAFFHHAVVPLDPGHKARDDTVCMADTSQIKSLRKLN